MLTRTTYQLRGYCAREGYEQLDRVLVECARLYNAALQEWRDAWEMQGVSVSLYSQYRELTAIRQDDPEGWGNLHAFIGRGVLRRLDLARNAFYRRVKAGETPGYPRFKSSRQWKCIDLSNVRPSMVKGDEVRVKGLPSITIKPHQPLPSSELLKSLRIVRRGRRVEVNLTYEVDKSPLPPTQTAVGIDMGISDRMVLSSGEAVERREVDRESLANAERRLARCRKGSREWRRRVKVVANLHSRQRVRNRNECHRITTNIVRRYGHIGIEKLNVKNMTRSAAGTVEEPGTNVAAKSGLNREIYSQTWGLIRNQLTYKAEWAGRTLVEVDPKHTSQTCSRCGVIDGSNRQGKSYACRHCGLEMDSDLNAAINILRKSMAGGNSPPPSSETEEMPVLGGSLDALAAVGTPQFRLIKC